MGRMVEGKWTTEWYKPDSSGAFKRPDTVFRNRLDPDGAHPPELGRYHLYVSYACPWAHRTLIARSLHGLTDHISVSVVASFMGDDGWVFDPNEKDATEDHISNHPFLREVYKSANAQYTGRVTVPILWDKKEQTIVNNESIEILEMMDDQLAALVDSPIRLFPDGLRDEVWAMVKRIYEPINNGVYRCGFAGSQSAYDLAFNELFETLDELEVELGERRFLCGDQLTAADICLFTTLVRFDAVYHTHFKTNKHRIVDYPNLWGFVRDLYQHEGVAATVNMRHIKEHYFRSHETINPKRIVANGPVIDFDTPHDRQKLM